MFSPLKLNTIKTLDYHQSPGRESFIKSIEAHVYLKLAKNNMQRFRLTQGVFWQSREAWVQKATRLTITSTEALMVFVVFGAQWEVPGLSSSPDNKQPTGKLQFCKFALQTLSSEAETYHKLGSNNREVM